MNNNAVSSTLERSDIEYAIERAVAQKLTEPSPNELRLLFNGSLYPARKVFLDALKRRMRGQNFVSVTDNSITTNLQRCGFTVLPGQKKYFQGGLRDQLFEILELQKHYSPLNTAEMSRRGHLIRVVVPEILRRQLGTLEPIFTGAHFSCAVEGSDGKGRKNASPWVRLFDPLMSTSATQGWYIVLHFSLLGDRIYMGLGCGATKFVNGSFTALPNSLLVGRIAWARKIALLYDNRFSTKVLLHGNALSRQFEKAMAYAVEYDVSNFSDEQFWSDLAELCTALVRIYQLERIGQEPGATTLMGDDYDKVTEEAINPAKLRKGQGRGLTAIERRAVELRAMEVATLGLREAGFTDIRDVSAKSSYDLIAAKNGKEWLIEVKGTTSSLANAFLMTAAELRLHRKLQGQTVLALVSKILLETEGTALTASAGFLEMFEPWDVDAWEFVPTAYRAEKTEFAHQSPLASELPNP